MRRQFTIAFSVIFGVLVAGFVGFLISAAYFTSLTGTFSLLWIGSFVFAVFIVVFSVAIWCCSRSP